MVYVSRYSMAQSIVRHFPVGTGKGPNAKGGIVVDCGVANFGMVRM